MKIAVASPPYPESLKDGLFWVNKLVKEAADKQAEIICFPESYLPGYPGMGVDEEARSPENLRKALHKVCELAAEYRVVVIIPMDWHDSGKLLNVAFVISNEGKILGYQSKNQLDPTEDILWSSGTERSLFEVNGVKFGITICHEGFRYPESVRWSAMNGAKIVFHPNCTGSNQEGNIPSEWGNKDNPYYEKAQMMRALENTIYFATSNYSFLFPDSASAIIAPDGKCLSFQPYGEPGVQVVEIDLEKATGLLAKRFKGELYRS